MLKDFSARVKYKSLSAVMVIALVIAMLAAGAYAGSFPAVTGAAAVEHGSKAGNDTAVLPGNHALETSPVTTLTAQGTYTANYVYTDDAVDTSPSDQTYDDPDSDEDQDPLRSTINQTIEQGETASGKVDVPDGATVKIGEQPANGTATVDQDGNWEYTPDSGFTGEDQFTIIIEHDDGSEEIITATVTVAEAQTEVEDENDDPEEETLPTSGGVVFASIIALWLFVAASLSLRAGIVSKKK